MEVVFNAQHLSTTTQQTKPANRACRIVQPVLRPQFAWLVVQDGNEPTPVLTACNAQETPISMQALKLAKPAIPRVKPAQDQDHLRVQLAQPRQTFTRERV